MAGDTPWFRRMVPQSGACHYPVAMDVHAVTSARHEKVDRMTSPAAARQATRFSGHAMLHASAGEGDAFVGTNQAFGGPKKNILTVLHFNAEVAAYQDKATSCANGFYRNLP